MGWHIHGSSLKVGDVIRPSQYKKKIGIAKGVVAGGEQLEQYPRSKDTDDLTQD